MKKLFFIVFPVILITCATIYWYFNFTELEAVKTLTVLEKTGDECSYISEKAAMHLPEA